jgi:hypothetical protein
MVKVFRVEQRNEKLRSNSARTSSRLVFGQPIDELRRYHAPSLRQDRQTVMMGDLS